MELSQGQKDNLMNQADHILEHGEFYEIKSPISPNETVIGEATSWEKAILTVLEKLDSLSKKGAAASNEIFFLYETAWRSIRSRLEISNEMQLLAIRRGWKIVLIDQENIVKNIGTLLEILKELEELFAELRSCDD